jgi:hypothetical protein
MSNTIDFKKKFQFPSDEIFLLCGTAVEGLKKGRIISTDPVMGKIKGVFGGSWKSTGCGVEIEVIPHSQEDCTLTLTVYPLGGNGKKATFGGKNLAENGLKEFIEELETRVKRFETKYK